MTALFFFSFSHFIIVYIFLLLSFLFFASVSFSTRFVVSAVGFSGFDFNFFFIRLISGNKGEALIIMNWHFVILCSFAKCVSSILPATWPGFWQTRGEASLDRCSFSKSVDINFKNFLFYSLWMAPILRLLQRRIVLEQRRQPKKKAEKTFFYYVLFLFLFVLFFLLSLLFFSSILPILSSSSSSHFTSAHFFAVLQSSFYSRFDLTSVFLLPSFLFCFFVSFSTLFCCFCPFLFS